MSDPILPFPAPGEDTPAEAAAEAAADAALAAQVAAWYAAAGPDPEAAARCAAEVQARARRQQQPWLQRRWWWGGAAAAALLLVATLRQDRRHGEDALLPPAPVAEPGTQLTRFAVTLPPGARSVTLVGDFNGWDADATPMRPTGHAGAWSASIPLPPGRHVYAFVVDGRDWRVDPLAPQVPDEGLGPANAVIVDGPR